MNGNSLVYGYILIKLALMFTLVIYRGSNSDKVFVLKDDLHLSVLTWI